MGTTSAGQVALAKRRTTLVSIIAATVLVALKLGVGLATASLGLISAGIESSGDVLAAVLTFFVVRLSGRPADEDHPYGHRRAENLGALGEAAILLAGGLLVAIEAVTRLASGEGPPRIHWYQFAVLGIALAVDFSRTSVSLTAARRLRSPALRANALHFAADMVGSLAVLVGLVLVKAGFDQGDSLAALFVAGIILITALRLIAVNANVLMDRAPEQAQARAERAIAALGQEIELSRLRLRESAGRYFADVVVSVPAGQAVIEGHMAADLVEQAIEEALPGSDVVVHVEPRARGLDLRERVLAIALAEPLVKEVHDINVLDQEGAMSVSLHLKFPADLGLREADEIAARIELAIEARPGVSDVQTHLEPLERTLDAGRRDRMRSGEEQLRATIGQVVRERIGHAPRRVRILPTDAGPVVFLTLGVDGLGALADAHALASELEEELRRRIPEIADVVVRTEPGGQV